MNNSDVRVCILRSGGINRDGDVQRVFASLGANAEIVHINRLAKSKNLLDYHIIVVPGGFSYGDYVRSGAILGKELVTRLGGEMKQFIEQERAVMGICNGFQILVEAGLLPGFEGISELPQAALANNASARFECRWVSMKAGKSSCVFTKNLFSVIRAPTAHGEGRFLAGEKTLQALEENKQIALRYCKPDGSDAAGQYPYNPNGSVNDIAGICNPSGNIFGLMPHPEDAFFGYQYPDWTSSGSNESTHPVFESVLDYIQRKF